MTEPLVVHSRDAVTTLTLNRPEIRNAFDDAQIARLTQALRTAEADPAVRVVVIAGNGPAFCAGADLNWMRRMAGYTYEQNLADATALAEMLRTLDRMTKPLKGLKVASYYGCMVLRPPDEVAYDDPDHPQSLDDLMAALGATPVDFAHKNECCGAYLAVKDPDVTREMVYTILKSAQAAGTEAVVTNCPLCQFNLDKQQAQMQKLHAGYQPVPVFYFSQLMGLALGLDASDYGWERHYIDARPLLSQRGFWNGKADVS